MPRAVRFEVEPPPTPDPCTPHHTDKGLTPRGILLKSGTFEDKTLKTGRFNPRRHSTPIDKLSSTMQNMSVAVDTSHDHHHQRHLSVDQRYAPYLFAKPHASVKDMHSGQMARLPLASLSSQNSNTSWDTADLDRSHSSDIRMRWNTHDEHSILPWQVPQNTHHTRYSPATATPTFYQTRYSSNAMPELESRPYSLRDVRVHHHLARPDIVWNIVLPLSSAVFDAHSRLQLSELDSPATTPAVNKLTIKFDHSLIIEPWKSRWHSIQVRGSCPIPYGAGGETIHAVTIRDVLDALHNFFQVPLTEEEYTSVTPSQAQKILDAHHRRTATLPYYGGAVPNLEPLRADVLGGLTCFVGVQITSTKKDRLILGLDLAPAY